MKCLNPKCVRKPGLVHFAHDDSMSHRKYVCPDCLVGYLVTTPLGKAIQAAPLVTGAAVTAGVTVSLWGELTDALADFDIF